MEAERARHGHPFLACWTAAKYLRAFSVSRVIAAAESGDVDQIGSRAHRPGSRRDEVSTVATLNAAGRHELDLGKRARSDLM